MRIGREQLQVNRAQLQSNEDATRRQLEISEAGQFTERFTRAVEQMGSNKTAVRLGAVYALERIASNSPSDRRAIIEILSAYIKSYSSQRSSNSEDAPPSNADPQTAINPQGDDSEQQPSLIPHLRDRAPDIQAAITVLTRDSLAGGKDAPALYLPNVDLRMSDLRRADLSRARLYRVESRPGAAA